MTTYGAVGTGPLIRGEGPRFDNSVKSNILGSYNEKESMRERTREQWDVCEEVCVCVEERERSETNQERIKRQRQYTRERDLRETFFTVRAVASV